MRISISAYFKTCVVLTFFDGPDLGVIPVIVVHADVYALAGLVADHRRTERGLLADEPFESVLPERCYEPDGHLLVVILEIQHDAVKETDLVGAGLCVRAGGATTGDDALAMSLSHLTKIPIQWIYLTSDLIVLGLSLTYIPVRRIGYSLLTVILSGQLIGLMQRIKGRPEAG